MNAIPTVPISELRTSVSPNNISSLAGFNGRLATPALARLLLDTDGDGYGWYIETIEALANLPPTLSSCDLLGGLLRLEREKTRESAPHSVLSKPGRCLTLRQRAENFIYSALRGDCRYPPSRH